MFIFLTTKHDFGRWKQPLFYILFFTHLCQDIDNCFYDFGNTRNIPKFATLCEHQPTQIG